MPVRPDLTVPGHPEVFVIGDLANYAHQTSVPLPGRCPRRHATGTPVAASIRGGPSCRKTPSPFRYRDYGTMATIGRAGAVAIISPLRFSGFLAWLAWLFVHLMYLVEFQNRILVLLQWAWNYFTWNHAARLITGENAAQRSNSENMQNVLNRRLHEERRGDDKMATQADGRRQSGTDP